MPFEIVRNDIVNMQVDAVVNTANRKPIVGSGVDCEIHREAGVELLKARKKIGRIGFGEAVITSGFGLAAKYVIHTVGPVWEDGSHGEEDILVSCYRKALALAKKRGCESIAFPLIAAGEDGFPKSLALQIAVREIGDFLLENDMQVYLVVFGKEAFVLSEKLVRLVSSYIDENYIYSKTVDVYRSENADGSRFETRRIWDTPRRSKGIYGDVCLPQAMEACPAMPVRANGPMGSKNWEKRLKDLDAGFSETLLKLIDRTGKKDSEIYKKANVDRKLFSKIRNNMDYRPSKATALAFAFADVVSF